jgi:AraC-like DNA-binding protein
LPSISDPTFALRAAECWHPSNLGALGFAWLSSSTLRTGLQRVVRYWRLLGERSSSELLEAADGLTLAFDSGQSDPVAAAVTADFSMALLVSMCRMNYGAALRPVEVTLKYDRRGAGLRYQAHFRCPVRLDAPGNSFTLARGDAERALPSANRQIAAVLDQVLTDQLAHLDRSNVVARCKASLLEQLPSGELTEAQLARTLNMSRRTLQRKLAEAETTYLKLVEDTRRDLALRYLEDPRHSITDITFMLGFSQQSAFTRAFRRWTGHSPTTYRERRGVERPATPAG